MKLDRHNHSHATTRNVAVALSHTSSEVEAERLKVLVLGIDEPTSPERQMTMSSIAGLLVNVQDQNLQAHSQFNQPLLQHRYGIARDSNMTSCCT